MLRSTKRAMVPGKSQVEIFSLISVVNLAKRKSPNTLKWHLTHLKNTHMYMCGLKGMEGGLVEALGHIAESKGLVWAEFVKEWKKEKRWHVEVY